MLLARCRKINKNRAMNETRIFWLLFYISALMKAFFCVCRVGVKKELNEWLNGWDKMSLSSRFPKPSFSSLRIFISSFGFSSSSFPLTLFENDWIVFISLLFGSLMSKAKGCEYFHPNHLRIFHVITPCQQVLFFPVIDRKNFEIKFLAVEWHSKQFFCESKFLFPKFTMILRW